MMETMRMEGDLSEKRSVLLRLFQGALALTFLACIFGNGIAYGKEDSFALTSTRDKRAVGGLARPTEDELKSLVFVFDVTGSMHDDWEGAISGGKRILKEFLSYKKRPVRNYVLVPFGDPTFGPAMATENSDKFLDELNKLIIGGGGDCPEMSVSAIKEALETAYPYSYLYVFTDASAKDYQKINEVLKLIERKHSQVIFFITGDCEEPDKPSFLVYEKIAAASFGQMYYLLKSNVNDVLKSVLITTKPNKSNLLVISSPEMDSKNSVKYNLSVESNLEELVVEVAGYSPEVDIRNPLGNPPDKISIPIDLPNNKFIVIDHPKPAGNWVLKVTFHPEKKGEYSIGNTLITASGIGSAFVIQLGFSVKPAKRLSDTAYRPLEGAENYIYMEVDPAEDTVENKEKMLKYKWTSVDIMKSNGDVHMSLPLTYIKPDVGEENFPIKFLGGPFIPPDNNFNLAFHGLDEDGHPVMRLSSNFISPEQANAPFVKLATSHEGVLGKDLIIKCEVESLIKFTLNWYKDGIPFGGERQFMQSSDASLVIPNIKREDKGQYKCEATNARGSDSKVTDISVLALPEINGMEDKLLIIPEGKSITINCDVISDLVYDVKWAHKHDGREEDISAMVPMRSNIQILPNNSLSLSLVKKIDSGIYACSASNKAGTTVKEVEIIVGSSPKITISPEDKFEFLKGESIKINCNVVSSLKTKVHWEFNGVEVGASKEIDSDDTIPLVIPAANKNKEGTYTCVAENDAGRVQKEVKGVYIVLPQVKVIYPYMAVKAGSDATLMCSISGIPTPDITWTVGNRLIENGAKYQISSDGSSLRILKTDLSDEGTYKCMANGPRNSKSTAEIKLRIGIPPKPRQSFLNKDLELEKDGLFPCEAETDAENYLYPGMNVDISWKRVNGVLDLTRQKIQKSGSLSITGAEVTDGGMYDCTLRNAFGESHMILNLKIKGAIPPTLLDGKREDIPFRRGEVIVLWCNATGRPEPRIIWSYQANESSIPEELEDGYAEKDVILVSGGKMTLLNVNSHYQGIYSCSAESAAGITSKPKLYYLRLQAPPVLSDDGSPVKAIVAEGASYTFSCTAVGTPQPSFKWIKDDRYLIDRNITRAYILEKDKSSLKIPSAVPGFHDGTYKCIASNDAGKAVKKFTIKVEKIGK